jgi:hypothetical protein
VDAWESGGPDGIESPDVFLDQAEAAFGFAHGLADAYDVVVSYVPDDDIGWEVTIKVEPLGEDGYVSRRVADLIAEGDGWYDSLCGAVEEALETLPRSA